ncbi:unnamed protein product [Allacma fusca]|uniref:Uncharacterized protein n=1 Tax=Allacma fusca TaxID=39272 RepID=A0A8J2KH03_9HEXA|nr:unnamed protein product [Allacma fusca]
MRDLKQREAERLHLKQREASRTRDFPKPRNGRLPALDSDESQSAVTSVAYPHAIRMPTANSVKPKDRLCRLTHWFDDA